MKKLKLIMLVIIAILFLEIGNVSAQEKSTVIISGYSYGTKYRIEIIKPNYEVEQKEMAKDENALAFTKKEIDYWLNQNYKLSEATTNALASGERFLFILIKEE